MRIQHILRGLMVLSLAAPALVFAIYAAFSYAEAFRQAEIRAGHLSALLQEHALKVFETIGMALTETDQRLKGIEDQEIRTSRKLWDELKRLQSSSEQLGSIFVLDAQGALLLTTRVFPTPAVDFADRDYYTAHTQGHADLYMGRGYVGRISSTPIFNFSIRRGSPEGTFEGIVGSSVDVDYFEDFYKTVGDPADNFAVILARDDGNLLVRYPAAAAGLKLDTGAPFFRSVVGAGQGVFYSVSPVDGIERLYGLTKLRRFPAYVMYSIERASILRKWYRSLAVSGAIAAFFAATLFLMAAFALRQADTEASALEQVRRTSESLADEIERRRRAEASLLQAQRLDAVGKLTGGIAHDFNNLLQIILGNLDLAQRRADPAGMKKAVTFAQYAARRGAELTRSLLAFSRQQALHPEVVDLNAVIERARSWVGRTISDAIELAFAYEPALWPVRVDVAQFEAALLNLVVNARDAMAEGGKLSLRTRNVVVDAAKIAARGLELTPGEYVEVSVADTGSGMSSEVRARVFEPFFTTKESGKGSGLGLSQVYGFVGQSGGGIGIETELGFGTTVSLYLPRSHEPAVQPAAEDRSLPGVVTAPAGVALIVEDNDDVRRIAAGMFEDLGYTALLARNGIEAWAMLSAGEPIDILFSDVSMPRGISGIQLAEQALALRPDLKILLSTASIEVDARFPILRKPYSRDELSRRIAALRAGASPARSESAS